MLPDDPLKRADIVARTLVVPSHNGIECREHLAKLRPHIIVVYGTAVLKLHVIECASKLAINMHTGIAPRYRGSSSVFWALHNAEPEWVGVTIHALDSGIDSGPILSIRRPAIAAADDEASLFAKCVVVGLSQLAQTVCDVYQDRITGEPQNLSIGREYRSADRTVAAERKVEQCLRDGLVRRYAEARS